MNIKKIQKFDKLIKSAKLNTFKEIYEIINNLIKIEVNVSQNELLQKISQNIEFKSVDDMQNFLSEYFEFHNILIAEFERLESIEDDDLFDKEIQKLAKNILQTVESENRQDALLDFIFKIVETVMSEYSIDLTDDSDENLKNLTQVFGSEDIAVLFVSVNIIALHLSENRNVKYDELVDMGQSVIIFCMAMSSLRKDDYNNSQNMQNSSNNSVNNTDYNVGRNDPCPCGSGRKYKKCCLNKSKAKLSHSLNFEEPKDILLPLSKEEIQELYAIWSRFLNFVSKAYAGVSGEKYIEIYDKNSKGEYFLTDGAIGVARHYLTIRNFLNEYFFMLVEHFLDDNRVSQKNKDILYEIRDSYKFGHFYSFEMFSNGNAIFYNLEKLNCFYAYKTFYDYSKVFPKNEMFDTMFFSYKGRIISDGVATKQNVELGENINSMILEDYKKDRENLSFSLSKNEPQKQEVYQLKISIKGAKPPIWRRVLVKPNTTFYGLHSIIQNVFNWEDYHMYIFFGDEKRYTDAEMISEDFLGGNGEVPANEYSIDSELKNIKDKIKYIYDFGDDWEHHILLEKILPVDTTLSYPLCTGGKRRGPLEDSGGIWNYNDIADAMENPTFDNQHILGGDEEYYEDIDPTEFHKELVNLKLREY